MAPKLNFVEGPKAPPPTKPTSWFGGLEPWAKALIIVAGILVFVFIFSSIMMLWHRRHRLQGYRAHHSYQDPFHSRHSSVTLQSIPKHQRTSSSNSAQSQHLTVPKQADESWRKKYSGPRKIKIPGISGLEHLPENRAYMLQRQQQRKQQQELEQQQPQQQQQYRQYSQLPYQPPYQQQQQQYKLNLPHRHPNHQYTPTQTSTASLLPPPYISISSPSPSTPHTTPHTTSNTAPPIQSVPTSGVYATIAGVQADMAREHHTQHHTTTTHQVHSGRTSRASTACASTQDGGGWGPGMEGARARELEGEIQQHLRASVVQRPREVVLPEPQPVPMQGQVAMNARGVGSPYGYVHGFGYSPAHAP